MQIKISYLIYKEHDTNFYRIHFLHDIAKHIWKCIKFTALLFQYKKRFIFYKNKQIYGTLKIYFEVLIFLILISSVLL